MQNKKHVSTPLDAYIVPTADAHNSEYVADCDKRRQYISGFTGSAGTAVVTASKAALWTDGRYHTQVLFYFYFFETGSTWGVPSIGAGGGGTCPQRFFWSLGSGGGNEIVGWE